MGLIAHGNKELHKMQWCEQIWKSKHHNKVHLLGLSRTLKEDCGAPLYLNTVGPWAGMILRRMEGLWELDQSQESFYGKYPIKCLLTFHVEEISFMLN